MFLLMVPSLVPYWKKDAKYNKKFTTYPHPKVQGTS